MTETRRKFIKKLDKITIIRKRFEKPKHIVPLVVYWFVKFLALFNPRVALFHQGFYRWILWSGSTGQKKRSSLTEINRSFYDVRHEYQHCYDSLKNPILFGLSYLFPVVINPFRVFWELKGYSHQLLGEYRVFGKIQKSYRSRIVDLLSSGTYLWAWPFKRHLRKYVDRLCDAIEDESLKDSEIEITNKKMLKILRSKK